MSASSTHFTLFLMDADPESVQRLMLASSFTEPVGKAEEVRLIDGVLSMITETGPRICIE
jgi:hypothetical protein